VLRTAGGTPNVNSALGDLSNSFNGGTIVTGDMQDIIDSASSVLDQVGGIGGMVDISGILAALQADIDAANAGSGGSNGGGIIDPTPSETADAADLVKSKPLSAMYALGVRLSRMRLASTVAPLRYRPG